MDKFILEENPNMGIANKSNEYFSMAFSRFILDKVCFEYWKIKNDHETYEGMPDAIKLDMFIENCFMNSYDNELTFLYR